MKKRKPTREEIRRYIEQSREMLEGDIPEDEEMADLFNKMSRDSMENAKTDESEQAQHTGIFVDHFPKREKKQDQNPED